MASNSHNFMSERLAPSKRALALPITFLILLASTLSIVSVTYYFAVERISTQSQTLKVSTAKQNFLSFDNAVVSTLWQPGSSTTFEVPDSGGTTNIQPANNTLTISVYDNASIDETIFNSSIGQINYALPFSSWPSGLYFEGDSRTITNQSGSPISQLFLANNGQGPQIQLQYRPLVTYASGETINGQEVTNVRIYIVSLNGSDTVALQGKLPFKIACTSVQSTTNSFQISNQPESFSIAAQLNGANGSVSIPIPSTSDGSIINLETVISNIAITRLTS